MIKIIDGYGFEHDDMNFVLYAVGTRQKTSCFGRTAAEGEMVEYKDVLGYYSSLQALCEACLKIATRKGAESANVKNLGDYIEIMKQIASEIRSAVDITAF